MLKSLYQKLRLYGFKKFIQYSASEGWGILYWHGVKKSYSQHQEDLMIDRLLNYKKNGFYIDIGAADCNRFNNTKRFYLKGWNGINIEPNASLLKKIEKNRKRDINLNIGIGNTNEKIIFFIFFPDTLSTFSKKEAYNYVSQGFKIVEEVKIEVKKLSEVFQKYVSGEIDFLSVDTEGYDLDVLKSNDWGKYRPKIICAELQTHNGDNTESLNIENYLKSIGYIKKNDNGLNGIFMDSKIN